jgi:hypothetical protein
MLFLVTALLTAIAIKKGGWEVIAIMWFFFLLAEAVG